MVHFASQTTCANVVIGGPGPCRFPLNGGVTADTAMRLSRDFGGDAQSWLNLQTAYDLRTAEIKNGKRIEREIKPTRAAA